MPNLHVFPWDGRSEKVNMMSKDIRITILVDNHAGAGLYSEHGLAMWIEADGRTVLFDSGQGGAFVNNLKALGFNAGNADAFVLSHGHYDHTGNVAYVLERAPGVEVFGHPGIVRPRYALHGGAAKSIKIPGEAMTAIDGLPSHQLHWVQQPRMLSENIGLTGPIPRDTDFEDTGGPFYLDTAGDRPDNIDDDLALWIRTDRGIVVCVGCCHAGLVNTLRHIQRISGEDRIRAVIGGLHLVNADGNRIQRTIDELEIFTPEVIAPCHCTGEAAVVALAGSFDGRVSPGEAGRVYRFDGTGS
jgi:7,8-dihydropterin-6-yl-methyl-4-(beta-D-ribofuranosyl)aminobenzene 5'-phosphate synthase